MNIKITQQPDDGNFTIGNVYKVQMKSNMFVYAYDEDGNVECVYNYQFVQVQ